MFTFYFSAKLNTEKATMSANPMQVVCVMTLTPINSKDQKGAEVADIEVRKKAYEDLEKACSW